MTDHAKQALLDLKAHQQSANDHLWSSLRGQHSYKNDQQNVIMAAAQAAFFV